MKPKFNLDCFDMDLYLLWIRYKTQKKKKQGGNKNGKNSKRGN